MQIYLVSLANGSIADGSLFSQLSGASFYLFFIVLMGVATVVFCDQPEDGSRWKGLAGVVANFNWQASKKTWEGQYQPVLNVAIGLSFSANESTGIANMSVFDYFWHSIHPITDQGELSKLK